ncbi:MAG TPA: AAA-like domain-containing protein [Nodularia sp. (in: cyanobacteria)]|nr:AAA-like domain-containing protein [Nodularia sp. (in: cyanobacteria)]
MNNQQFLSQPDPDYYVVGGTLKASARCYIPRIADEELLESLKKGDYCYILTTRQMGKSSLVIRSAANLKNFNICSAYIDLSAIGKDVTVESWYLGQIKRIVQKVCKDFNYIGWWKENASFSEVDRYVTFLSEILLQQISSPVVIFIDEIDYTLNLSYSDDFFAAIRSLYNQRANDSELNRLTFVLLGVASPSDLIKEFERTPFNVGKRIELNDFTLAEARELAVGLAPEPEIACKMLEQILGWTGGHPYITQKACSELAKWAQNNWNSSQSETIVETIIKQTFLTEHGKNKDDNLIFVRNRFLRSSKSAELLNLYKLVRQGEEIFDDERNPTRTELKLIGIVKVDASRKLQVRNQIYYQIFNLSWIELNMNIREEEVVEIVFNNIGGVNNFSIQGDTNFSRQGNNNFIVRDANQNTLFSFNNKNFANSLYRTTYRNRQAILNKVQTSWISGVLKRSLHYRSLIKVGLEERPDCVDVPFENSLINSEQLRITLASGTRVIDVWDNMGIGRTLLILGEPGSGKTTLLLELGRELIIRALEDINHLIPVIFSLSSWTQEGSNIADWIVKELQTSYQVAQKLGETWVKEQQLLLLLDGLDEVSIIAQDSCIQALNEFIQRYPQTEMVVCSRMKSYLASSNRLRFQTAISLQPLSYEQIRSYLFSAELESATINSLLREDTTLKEVIKSPLMLNIMLFAYRNSPTSDLLKMQSVEEVRQHLFNTYIDQVFQWRRTKFRYLEYDTKRWLSWLAKIMLQESQPMFFIEYMQPTLLQNQTQRIMYSCGLGLTGGLVFGLMGGIVFGLKSVIFVGLGGGLGFGLFLGTLGRKKIEPVGRIKLSQLSLITSYSATSILTTLLSSLLGLSVNLLFTYASSLNFYLIPGFLGIGIVSLSLGLLLNRSSNKVQKTTSTEKTIIPNQGIRDSAKNATTLGLIVGLIIGLIGLLIGGLRGGLIGFTVGILSGLLNNAGVACIQHFWLRVILWSGRYIPWNYARFLNYATERVFLQKVGGGYIFIHSGLLEHFATMEIKLR